MNVVNQYGEKRNGFAEVVAFCHVTCRYFDRFLLQGVDKNWRQACFFYLAPGLICEGYWQVNSRRSIFRIADPIKGRMHARYLLLMLLVSNYPRASHLKKPLLMLMVRKYFPITLCSYVNSPDTLNQRHCSINIYIPYNIHAYSYIASYIHSIRTSTG